MSQFAQLQKYADFLDPSQTPPHHLFGPPPSIGVHALMKDVHNYNEWKRDLHHSIMLDCNEWWSWDFTWVPMVPECLFWPAERPPCPNSRFWFRGCQHSEPHKVPDPGSMSDPWDVLLSTSMPCDVLWSYLAFQVISVSGVLFFSCLLTFRFPSLVSSPCCIVWWSIDQWSSFLFPAALSDVLVVRVCSLRQRLAHWPVRGEQWPGS